VEKKDKRYAMLANPLKLEISLSSLDIIYELWRKWEYRIEFNSKASEPKGKDRGSPNWWPSVLRINVKSNSSNIIDELWGNKNKEWVQQQSELKGKMEKIINDS